MYYNIVRETFQKSNMNQSGCREVKLGRRWSGIPQEPPANFEKSKRAKSAHKLGCVGIFAEFTWRVSLLPGGGEDVPAVRERPD